MSAGMCFSSKYSRTPPRVRLKTTRCFLSVFWFVFCVHIVSANRPPRFLIDGRSEIVLRLKEGPDTPIGSLIYRLRAIDPDGDTLRFGIREQIGSDILRIEAISSNEANIYLVKELDREIRDEYSFVLTLTDGLLGEGNYITQSLLLLVEDVNDNEPIFKPYPSAISVKEDASPGVLLTVEATDLDEGAYGQVLYNLQELDGDIENFVIQTVNGKGVIRLTNRLDYESKSLYQLRVLAVDRANQGRVNTGTAAILIKVQDVEDQPPEFLVASPVTRISEDAPVGTSVLQVRAIDGDRGINNRISYSIISGGEEHFDIDSSSGVVFTVNPLDREDPNNSNGAYILEILATEESHMISPLPSATTEVTIIVMDINDERPTFRSTRYIGEIIENAQQNTPITFLQDGVPEVFDYDQGKNGTFELYLEGDNGVFDVTPFKGVNEASFSIRVNDPTLLDYERITLMNFTLVAREIVSADPKTSSVPITVHIRDENDNFPEFTQAVYSTRVPENCVAGGAVGRVAAGDRDREGFGAAGVRYTALAGAVAHLLHLNPVSGVITFKQACDETFDRELVSRHFVTVEARDDLGRGNRNTAQLIINIEDVNDNAPMFLSNKYEARLLENEKEFENPLVVEARDIDLNGTENSRIEYSIVDGDYKNNFTIDPKLGIINPIVGLDFEQIPGPDGNVRRIHLTVQARDFGSPALSSMASVTVYLTDVNDHGPIFSQLSYRRAIPEDLAPGSSILQVKASDSDGSSPNNRVTFQLQRGADAFTVDALTGLLRLAPAAVIDPDRTRPRSTQHLLTVMASDGGIGDRQLSAVITVNITVLDVNNKPPVLIDPGVIHVRENTQVGAAATRLRAEDPDERPVLRYSLAPHGSSARGGGGAVLDVARYDFVGLWDLDAVDGTLRVARSPDREKVEIVKLAIEVEDLAAAEGGPRQIASGTLTIVVDDENDNNPKFRKPIYRSSVPENSKSGLPVLTVRADDADENATVTYELEGPEELLRLVHMDPSTGELVVASKIDHETQPWINITATATDAGVPPRRSTVDVHLQILDENDNNPIFEPSPFEYRVREDVEVGQTVTNIVAADGDSGEYGRITYLLDRVSTQGKFSINPDTGALRVSGELDREAQASYPLVVEAWDNYQFGFQSGESRNAFKQIVIYVEDVNDNSPVLLLPAGSTTISEFHDHREPILTVSATDADDVATPNGRVQFHLVGGKGHDLFYLEPHGADGNSARLFAQRPLRDRFGNYSLWVEARDGGVPPRASRGVLALVVTDYNDHAPVFLRPAATNTTLRVPENATIGTTVLEVKAIDADIGPNGAVRYRLGRDVRADYRAFALHDTSGALRTAVSLDRDKQTTYQLRIEAYDLGLPTPLSSSLDLTVYVQNVDHYRPRFPHKYFYLNITENEEHISYLPGVIERDETERGDEPVLPVCLYIVSGNHRGAFQLDRTTYRLTSKLLDREERDHYELSVLATEECAATPNYNETEDAGSTMTVVVAVKDVNDNAPQFISKIFTGGITTEADFGIEFMHIKAVDPDEGVNAEVNYYLTGEVKETLTEGLEGLAVAPFLVDRVTGAVALNFDPQRGMKGYFDFRVAANDSGGLADEAHVFIYLLRADQRVRVVLRAQRAALRERLPAFTARLAAVTGARVHVDDLRPHENRDGSVDATRSDLYLHLVDEDHSVLDVARVLELVDRNTERLDDLFKEFNVLDTQPASYEPPTAASLASSQAVYWLAWSALLLALLLLLAVGAALAQRADYGRKLRAATTAAYSSPTPGESDMTMRSSGGRVPNTNKHTTKGSNPIWLHAYENDWYKSDDQLSRSERDSLDENAVDRDLSNDKPYFITTASFPSILSDETETETEANRGNYDFYQQLEQMKNAKNMETTEL